MFCPKCKAEYREGFTMCADCKILLVYELPSEKEEAENYPDGEQFVNLEAIVMPVRWLSSIRYLELNI